MIKNKIKTIMVIFILIIVGGIEMGCSSKVSMRSSAEIVSDMGVGWNLGNSLDSKIEGGLGAEIADYETAWGNPVTTKKMIDTVKEAGFKTVRIPVNWGQHMGGYPEYKVDQEWMDRVQQVVDYVIDNEMYAIIDVHHDEDWCIPTYNNEWAAMDKLEKLWLQIAEYFQSYDEYLIFETINEPRLAGTEYEWNEGTAESRDVVNKLNLTAVNAIRSTGGNNEKRAIMIPTYADSGLEAVINGLQVPADDNIIVTIHAYTPYDFAMNEEGDNSWGSHSDKKDIKDELDRYYDAFILKGIPVVIGEFGSINKNNLADRTKLAGYIVKEAKKRGIACIWWDNNNVSSGKESFGILNRNTLQWYYPDIVKVMIESYYY